LGELVRFAGEAADALEAAHEACELLRAHALELVLLGPGLAQLGELLVDDGLDAREVGVGLGADGQRELAAELAPSDARAAIGGELLGRDQALVEARGL